MMKYKMLFATAALAAGLSLAGAASAATNLITNGDFSTVSPDPSLPPPGFVSSYSYVDPVNNPDGMIPEGTYTVTDNPNSVHPYWVSIPDGNNRLIVNGATSGTPFVWDTVSALPTTGKYDFSTQVADICCNSSFSGPDNSFALDFQVSVNGGAYESIASYTSTPASGGSYPDAGVFQTLTGSFTGQAGDTISLRLMDNNPAQSGNDFAIDNVSVSAAPEPGVWALMIAGVGMIGLTFRQARRKHGFTFARTLAG